MAVLAPDRILVLKLRYVGDVLLATPVLSRLREGFPKAHLTMLVNPGTEDVIRGHPALDDLLVVERRNLAWQWRFVRDLRARRFDLVVDLTDSDRSATLSRLTGASIRLGYNSEDRWRGHFYTRIVEADRFSMHQVRYHLAATEALGLSGPPPDPVLTIPAEARSSADHLLQGVGVESSRPLICLHPGARWWFKAWPAERFAGLVDLIQTETSAQALFLGGNQERSAGGKIAEAMKSPFRSLIGRTDLPQLSAVLARAVLMVSNDNGPMHMAAALRVPVIGLFGPSDPAVWGPWGPGHHVFYKGLDCRACFHPDCFRGEQNCMRLITLEEVWETVKRVLACVPR
jgi:predicted lipopolysaccharide heptosyltransferase III